MLLSPTATAEDSRPQSDSVPVTRKSTPATSRPKRTTLAYDERENTDDADDGQRLGYD